MKRKVFIPITVFGEQRREISLAYLTQKNITIPLHDSLKETWDAVDKDHTPESFSGLMVLVDLGLLEMADADPAFLKGIAEEWLQHVYAVASGVRWRREFVNVDYIIDWHASGKSFLLPGVFARCWELLDGRRTVRAILDLLEGTYGTALQPRAIRRFLEDLCSLGFLTGPESNAQMRNLNESVVPPWALDQETVRAYIQSAPVPWTVVYELTYRCNLTCNTCYAADYMKKNANNGYEELTTAGALRFIGQLGRLGLSHITLQGGEPLMRRDWPELVSAMRQNRMFVKVVTNASLIDHETAMRMVATGIRHTDVSLDGLDAATNDANRCTGAYAKALRGIDNLLSAGMPRVALAVTLTNANFHVVEQIPAFAQNLGIREVHLMRFVAKGAGKDAFNWVLNTDQNWRLADLINCRWPDEYPDLFVDTMRWRCDCGKVRCTVDPTGKVRPCTFHGMVCGDITSESIDAIWDHSEVLDILRRPSFYKKICSACADRFTCKATACSARVYEHIGELLSPECVRNSGEAEKLGEFDPQVGHKDRHMHDQ